MDQRHDESAAPREPRAARTAGSVAQEVRALLAAAEEAADAIRREAAAEAAAVVEERRRYETATGELRTLRELVAALAVGVEEVARQCDRVDQLLSGAVPSGGNPVADDPSAARSRELQDNPFRAAHARLEGYRMRLAGAAPEEVRRTLERRGVARPDELTREIFQGRHPGVDEGPDRR